MKKIIISVVAVIAFSVYGTSFCMANHDTNTTNSAIQIYSTRTVDVYKISGNGAVVTSKIKEGGVYDSESNTITVRGRSYSVQNNPDYGNNSRRGAYKYYAGGIYYFNL